MLKAFKKAAEICVEKHALRLCWSRNSHEKTSLRVLFVHRFTVSCPSASSTRPVFFPILDVVLRRDKVLIRI
jgi:hypothetical protein